jgi:hypothetical protein
MANTKLIEKTAHRGCEIEIYETWNPVDFDGVGFYYVIKDRQGDSRTEQTDEYWLGSVEQAKRNAVASIDWDLDVWWAISCLATYRNKTEHFALSYFGEEDGAISEGLAELNKRCPGYKYSVKFVRVNQ